MTAPGAPVVSVLMTAYNRGRFIGDAIDSVLAQRFTDFELVIVDDGSSTDRTVAIAGEYAARDSRVRVVQNPVTLGDYPNRNRAAALARGRYLRYHDSDDVMYPHCLEVLVELLDAEPRAACAISTGWAWPGGAAPMVLSPRQCYQREFLGFGLFMAGPGAAIFRAEWFRGLGGFPEGGPESDYRFWLRACASAHVLLAPANLFWYRTHEGQELTGRGAARAYARLAGAVWDALASADCPLDEAERHRARVNQTWTVAKHTWRDLKAGRVGLAWFRLRRAGLTVADWLRYFRRPSRRASAGTPVDSAGDYLVPDWLRLGPHASLRS